VNDFDELQRRMNREADKRRADLIEKALINGFVHAETVLESRDCCQLVDAHVLERRDDNFIVKDQALACSLVESLRDRL
jgi:hypothetical protein